MTIERVSTIPGTENQKFALATESILSESEREALKTMNEGEIKKFTGKLSYRTLIDLLADPKTPAAVRLGCAREGIDRDEGKAAQTVNNMNVSLTLPELVMASYKIKNEQLVIDNE